MKEQGALYVGLALLVLLAYLLVPMLTPFIVSAAIVFTLFPWREHPVVRRVLWLTLLLFATWLLITASAVVIPFILAFVLAYVLNPIVSALERRSVARWVSTTVIMVLLVGGVVTALVLLVPLLIVQVRGIIGSLTEWGQKSVYFIQEGGLAEWLGKYGMPVTVVNEWLERELPPRIQELLNAVFGGLLGLFTSLSSLAAQLLNIVLIPFVTFYILKDAKLIGRSLMELVPVSHQPTIRSYLSEANGMMGAYLRGQIVVAVIQGIISTFVLWLIGIDYALLLGIMTGILTFVPYIGIITSLIVTTLVALFGSDPSTGKLIAVIVMYLAQKVLENTVLVPKIVGTKVGLHPVLLIFSILVFGTLMGFVGLLIGVPATALLVMTFRFFRARTQPSQPVVVEV